MSKAFTRESDGEDDDGDVAAPALPIGIKNYLTPAGYARLRGELLDLLDVERPKIVTVTLSVDLSSLTSSTLPVKLWNGPDLMRTVSPAAYENFGLGFSAASAT